MPVRIWVGRFAMVGGQPQEESPLLRSFPRQRLDEEEDELYVLVEPASPGGREYCGQLVDAIGRLYRQDTLSMTGAVLRALQAAHQQLLDWNARTLREHRVEAGVSCLAVQERTAYLAQVGPSVAYHVGDGRFSRIAPENGAAEALGQSATIEPAFSRYQLSPGDLLLIASPSIDELLGEETLRSILLRGGDDALVELFRLARGQQEFSLVLLACVVEPETASTAAAPREQQKTAEQPPPLEPEPGPAEEALEAPATGEETAATEPPPGLSQPKVRLKGTEAEVRYLRTTGVRSAIPRVPALAILAVLVLAVIGLIAWCVIPSALQENRDQQYSDAVKAARGYLATASTTADPTAQREALRAASDALVDANELRPGEQEVVDLQAEVDAALAKLDAVVELPELELVVDVSERLPGAVSAKDLAVGGGGAYFLDREQARVIAVSLLVPNPDPFVLFQEGDLVGTEIAGQPQHIAWAQSLNALLILDDARRLIAVRPPEPGRLLTVRDADAWGSADGIAHENGDLYVLDRAGDQVWRYAPSESGFDSEREPLLASFDLDEAVELAVGDALYLIVGNDSIRRFRDRVQQPFTQAGIDRPLASPTSLVPLPDAGLLLVVDHQSTEDRIVVFSSDGTFLQQLKSPTFTDLRAIAVDETGGLLYVLEGGALYRTQMPAAP